jgi:hypothetical protein
MNTNKGDCMPKTKSTTKVIAKDGPMGWIFFTAWVGAAIYFVQQNEGFWGFVLAILQAAVWPAYVLHAVLKLLGI